MGNSKVFLGLDNIKSIMLGLQSGKLFLGETKLYPLEKSIGDAVVTCDSATYNGSVQTAQNIVVTLSGVTLVAGTDYTVTSNTGGTNAGTYPIVITGAGEYTGTTSGTFTINKVTPTVTAPTAVTGLVYNATAQALANAGSTNFGTLKYSLDNSTYTTSIPSGTNATSYTIYYRVDGDSNVNSVAANSISNSIAKVTPTVVSPVPNVLTYNGSAQELVTAGSTNFGTLKYKVGSDSWSTNIPTRTRGGAYTVYFKVDGDSNVNSVPEDTVACSINEKPVTAVITLSPASYTYSGSYCEPGVTVKDGETIIDPSEYTVTYSNNLNAGTATVTIYDVIGGDYYVTGSTTFTINKADTTYVAPTANNRTYDTTSKALLNAGSVTGGTIQYSTSQSGTYSTTIPSQTNAGTYTTWWKIVGDSNHNDNSPASISTTVSPKTVSSPTITLSQDTYTYENTAFQPTPTVKDGSTTISSGEYTVSYSNNTNVGTATCTITDKSGGNYTVSGSKTFTITCYSATAPTAKNGNWTGSAQALVNAGSTSYGTVVYSTDNSTFNTAIPSGTSAGSYTVYWKVTGNTNVCQTTSASITCSIKQVAMTYTAPSAATRTYTGSAQQIVSGGSANGGNIYYATSSAGASSSTTVPSQTNAGTYTIYWKAVPDSNHSGGTSSWAAISCSIAKKNVVCTAPTAKSLTYTGSAQALANAGSCEGGTIQYCSTSGGTYSTTIPTGTNAGSYTVWYKCSATATTNYSGTCSGSVSCSIAKKAFSYVAPKAAVRTYNGSAQQIVSGQSATGGAIYFSTASTGTGSATTVPTQTNAGAYTTYWRAVLTDTTNYSGSSTSWAAVTNCTINKAPITCCTPTAKSLTWTGSAQALVNGCTPTGGSMTYCTTSGGTYSSTIPSQTNAGTYTTWYKCSPDSNHSGSSSGSVSTTIAKAAMTYTAPKAATRNYSGSAQQIVSGQSATGGAIYFATSSAGASSSTTVPTQTNAGTYSTYWKAVPDSNHSGGTSSWAQVSNCVINKVPMTYTAPSTTTYTYGNTARALMSGGTASGGSIKYSTSQSGTYTTTVPTQTNAGTYTTWWKAEPDSNHSGGTSAASASTTISKASQSGPPTATGATTTYNTTATATASGGGGQGSLEWSNGNTQTSVGSKTTKARWAGNSNYNASAWSNEVTLTMNKANISPTVSISNWTYGGTASNPSVAGNSGSGTVTYYYKLSSDSSWSTTKPSNAGSYNIRADIAATTNYNSGTCTSNFTINKAAGSVSTAPANSNPGYGTSNYLCTEGSGTGTMMYRLGTSGSFSSTRPTASSSLNVGTYTLYYYAAESTNYNQSSTGSISVTVSKRSRTISWDTTPVGVGYRSTITVSATPSLGSGDGTVTYSTSNSNIASVNGNVVSGKTLGSFTLTATISEGTNYTSASTSCSISVSYEYNYLTFNATSSGTFKFSGTSSTSMYYSLNNGSTWTALSNNTNTPTISAGSKIMWRSSRTPQSAKALGTFSSTSNFTVEGNIMSIMYGDDFRGRKTFLGTTNQFNGLFKSCTHLTSATNLSLPATAITQSCYSRMFWDCESLIDAPSILPATKLADLCYSNMFYQCLNLKNPPTLPATTLGNSCYNGMFLNCIALETAPDLPATTLQQACYGDMFNNCQSLRKIKCLATNISATNCTNEWVSYVPSSGTFIKASSMSSWTTGINGIPSGWTVQNA